MILRLSGADFSANNIGKIDIIREITSDTKNYFPILAESLPMSKCLLCRILSAD